MEQTGFVIVGGGARGLWFTEILELELGEKVVAIVDTFTQGRPYIEQRLASKSITGVQMFDTLDDALRAFPAQHTAGVFVMTPEWTHLSVFRALVAGGYNIFLEKPVATTRQDAEEIERLSESYDKIVQIGFVLRYSPFYRKVKEWVDEDKIGRIVMAQLNERLTLNHGAKFKRSWHSQQRYTGGYLNEKCSHDLDLLCWFKEKQASPVRVASYGGRAFCRESIGETTCEACTQEQCPYRDDLSKYDKFYNGRVYLDHTAAGIGKCVYGMQTDINDNQSCLLVFSDGTHGVFSSVTMSGVPGRDICLHGTKGVIHGRLEQGELTLVPYDGSSSQTYDLDGLNAHGGGDTQVVREFVECVRTQNSPLSSVKDGVAATLLALDCDESAKQQRWVTVTPE